MAHSLGITCGTFKVYMTRIQVKLGWVGASQRVLALWAIAHREHLGIELPNAAQFPPVIAEGAPIRDPKRES
jgi:hypothetical protein